jgi:hypothetical protein
VELIMQSSIKTLLASVILASIFGPASAGTWTLDTKENGLDDSKSQVTVSAVAKDYGASAFVMCSDGAPEIRLVLREEYKESYAGQILPLLARADHGQIYNHESAITSNTDGKIMLVVKGVPLLEFQAFADAQKNITFGFAKDTETQWTFGASGSSQMLKVLENCQPQGATQSKAKDGKCYNVLGIEQACLVN